MAVLVLAVAIAYLVASAVLTALTVGQPRRAFDWRTSVCLTVVRLLLAVALVAVLLQVVAA